MASSWKRPFQLAARDQLKTVKFWPPTRQWTTTRLKSTAPESESNHWKKSKKFPKLKKWKWNKKLTRLLPMNQPSLSIDNWSMITQNNFWSKRVSLSSNMQISKELKESQLPSVLKFCQLLTAHKERMKFWVLAIPLKKSWSVKTKSSDSQDVREMKLVPSFWEDHLNTFLMKPKDHCMMLCVFWFKPSRTNKSFTEEETLKFKWLWNARSSPNQERVNNQSPSRPMPELWEPCQSLLLKMLDLMLMNWFTI